MKSTDRKQTLLHYLTNIVEKLYPNVLSFYEDLIIDDACTGTYQACTLIVIIVMLVSMEILEADVNALEKGLEAVKVEEALEPENFILFISFSMVNI